MRRGVILAAGLALLSVVKVYAFKFDRPTEIRLGPPWFMPIDSPQASCIRNEGEVLLICGIADPLAKQSVSLTIARIGPCPPCYAASLALARLVAGRPNAPEPTMPES